MKRTLVLSALFCAALGVAALGTPATAAADDWYYGRGHHYSPSHYGHHGGVIVDYGHHYPSWGHSHGSYYGGYSSPYYGGHSGHGYYGGHHGGHISFGGHHRGFSIHF